MYKLLVKVILPPSSAAAAMFASQFYINFQSTLNHNSKSFIHLPTSKHKTSKRRQPSHCIKINLIFPIAIIRRTLSFKNHFVGVQNHRLVFFFFAQWQYLTTRPEINGPGLFIIVSASLLENTLTRSRSIEREREVR